MPFTFNIFLFLAGAFSSAKLGCVVGKKSKIEVLRWVLALIISVAAIKVCLDIF